MTNVTRRALNRLLLDDFRQQLDKMHSALAEIFDLSVLTEAESSRAKRVLRGLLDEVFETVEATQKTTNPEDN